MQHWARCARFFRVHHVFWKDEHVVIEDMELSAWLKTELLVICLFSDLSRVRNVTLNATAAIYTHSSVKSVIERTESLADDASRVVNGPLDLVSIKISIWIYVFPFLI